MITRVNDKTIDTDYYEDAPDFDMLTDDFIDTEEFNDKLYDLCIFDSYDDYEYIEYKPKASEFLMDLYQYIEKQIGRDLQELEIEEVKNSWLEYYPRVIKEKEDTLLKRWVTDNE